MTFFVRVFLFTSLLALSNTALAKSIGDVRRDAAREAGGARIEPAGSYSESRERINGVVVLVGQFPIRLVSNVPGHAGVTRVAACTAQYYDNRYNTLLIGEIHLEGMPNFDLNAAGIQVTSLLEQPHYNGERVIQFDGVGAVPEQAQVWTNLNSVQVPLRVTYRRQVIRNNGAENVLEVVQDDVSLLMRNANDEGTGAWTLSVLMPGHQTVTETHPVNGPPGTLLPTWQERAFLTRLQRNHIEVPRFPNSEAACRFTYQAMRSEQTEEQLYFSLIQLWDMGRISRDGRPFPSDAGEAFVRGVMATRQAIRTGFPAELTLEEHDDHPTATYEARAHGHAPPPPSNANRIHFSGTGGRGRAQCEARRNPAGQYLMWAWEVYP